MVRELKELGDMTTSQYKALLNQVPALRSMFAEGTGEFTDLLSNHPNSGFMNFIEGIPSEYASPLPSTPGGAEKGKRLLRYDLNAIGNMATRELFLRQHGGYHTFDPRVADLIGGYANGAILDFYDPMTGWVRKARCIKTGGQCFTPIDDPDHGAYSEDPHWEFVDVNGDPKNRKFRLGDTREIAMPVGESGKTQTMTIPANCLGRVVMFLSGRLYDPGGQGVKSVAAMETKLHYVDGETNLEPFAIPQGLLLSVTYAQWLRNFNYRAMGAFFRKGDGLFVTIENYSKMDVGTVSVAFQYKECLE